MHRAVAGADGQAVGGGDRLGDVVLGVRHAPRRASGPWRGRPRCADDSVQPVPWVFAWRRAAPRAARPPSGVDQQVDAFGPLRVAALDQHGVGAEREQRLGLRAHLVFVCGERRVEQRGRLRQIRRDDQRARE